MNLDAGPLSLDVEIGGFGSPEVVFKSLAEALRAMGDGLAADLDILAHASPDAEPLLTSKAGRAAIDGARLMQIAPNAALVHAALADIALGLILEMQGGAAVARVSTGQSIVWIGPVSSVLGLGSSRPPLAMDLAQGLHGSARRAVALDGRRAAPDNLSFADAVVVLSGSAVRAKAAGHAIAKAVPTPSVEGARALAAEIIWDVLGAGARMGQRFKSQQLIEQAVLTAKGRGRTIGGPKADLLVRFGVSEWR